MRASETNSQSKLIQNSLVRRAERGDAPLTYSQRLAATLDGALAKYQVVTKVGMRQQDNLLYVALEPVGENIERFSNDGLAGDDLLAARSLLPVVHDLLMDLKLSWLKLAKISARLPGQSMPLWQDELLFQKAAPIAKTLMNPTGVQAANAGTIGEVSVHIGGDMSGQLLIGNNNHQAQYTYTYNVETGGVLNVAEKATVRARPTPLMLRPRRFEHLLDRRTVLPMLRESLWQGLPVEVYATAGFGKTSLMRHMAHDEQLVSAFPDGVVYLSAHRQLAEDLLQSLYDVFYEASPPLKPSYGQVQQSLTLKQSLVILNHLSLEKEEMDWLMAALPACTFVLVSVARFYWQEGAAIALKGLPLPESIALIQMELGRALAQDEQYAAKSLWAALSGNPLQLRRAAAQAKADDESLLVLVQSMQPAPGQTISARSLFQKIADKLSARQQSALALMGAMGSVALSAEQSQAISQDPAIAEVLNELADLHLVTAMGVDAVGVDGIGVDGIGVDGIGVETTTVDATYQLSADLIQLVPQRFSAQPWLVKATDYFVSEGVSHGTRQAGNTDAMLHLLEWTQKTGQWQQSLALSQRLDYALAISGQWAQWQHVLTDTVQAAEQLGDVAAKAWALHQLGTRSLALGEYSRADSWLSRSLRLREELGDLAGAAVTRHNLAMIAVPLVSGHGALPVDPTAVPAGMAGRGLLGSPRLLWGAGLLLGAVAVGGVGAAVLGLNPGPLQPPLRQVMPSDTEISFGERALTSASEPKGVVFTNAGPETLEIRQLLLSGEGDFALAAASPLASSSASSPGSQSCAVTVVLAAGEACEVKTTFTPTTVGKHTGEIVMVTGPTAVESRVVETRVQPVALLGTGTPNAVPSVSFDTPSLGFSQTLLNQTARKDVKVTNDGSAPLKISQVEIVGLRSRAFSIASEDCTALALPPNKRCNVVLHFTPTSAGVRTAELSFKSNAAGENALPLAGTGIVAQDPPSPGTPSPGTPSPGTVGQPPSPPVDPPQVPPLAQDDSFSIPIETSGSFDVLANDRDSDQLEIIAVTQGQHGSVETDGRQIKYVHSGSGAPTDSFTYEVRNGAGEQAIATVTVTVNTEPVPDPPPPGPTPGPTNQAPVAIDYNVTIEQGERLTINLLEDVFDPDGDRLSLSAVATLNAGGRLERSGKGAVTYVPPDDLPVGQGQQYTDSFEYTVTDGNGGEGQGSISITVLVPTPPTPPPGPMPTFAPPVVPLPPGREPIEIPSADETPPVDLPELR